MMRKQYFLISYIIFTVAVFSGCALNTKLDTQFWENKNSRTAICLTPYPVVAHVYRDVNGGILPGYVAIIDSWNEGLTAFVQKFDSEEFNRIIPIFLSELTKRGMQVTLLDVEVCNSMLTESEANKSETLNTLRKQSNADYLLLFRIPGWGIMQVGYPLFTKYYSQLTIRGSLLDLHDGQIKWRDNWSGSTKHKELIVGDWSQPPDYPNVAKAMHEVLTRRINELYESFFGRSSVEHR
jgi:hypothetical protein